jgi:phage gpG-like protein
MDARLKVTIKGLSRVNQRLDDILHRLQNPEPAMREASAYMVRSVKNRIYSTKKDPEGEDWEPLNDQTIRIRTMQGYEPDNILVRTGRLGRSIKVDRVDRRGFSVIADARDDKGRSYAGYHDEGTSRMPQRQFMGISDTNAERMARILNKFVLGQDFEEGSDE